jgi:deoxyguanosine kinase
MRTPEARYVAFEGPIAAGKTSLASMFASWIDAELVLEPFEENQFLEDFYGSDGARWALPMQLDFLVSRHRQLDAVKERAVVRPVVADYTYAKDAMFARLLLQGREWALYDRMRSALAAKAEEPGLIFYLDASNEILLERIRRRGRPYESEISSEYLSRLRAAYETDLLPRGDLRIVRIDTSTFDIENVDDMARLRGIMIAAMAGD